MFTKTADVKYIKYFMKMDELDFMSVPDHPLLHILSFLNYSDLAAYVRYFVRFNSINQWHTDSVLLGCS